MMIPEGDYLARALSAEILTSKAGNDYCEVWFKTAHGSVRWMGGLSERSIERTIATLRLCGCAFPNDDFTDLRGVEANEVKIVVEHEEYNGKKQARVKWVNDPNYVPKAKTMSDPERADLRARLRDRLRGAETQLPVAASAPRQEDSDVPF